MLCSWKKGRIFVTLDVSFREGVCFYSSTIEKLLYVKSEEINLLNLDLVTLPVYLGSLNETGTELF